MNQREKRRGITSRLAGIAIAGILVTGIALMAYPGVSDWWNRMHQTRAIAGYVEQVADLTPERYQNMWDEAVQYNEELPDDSSRFVPDEEEDAHYREILDVTGTGIMGYVQIPSIHVDLPIYHGTDSTVLQIAIGHIEGSSLPVGGMGTHCVISGHTGLPTARLFNDIDKLKRGDAFYLQVLDQTLTYEVDQVKVVLPDEMDDLAIDPGEDFCTLVTCTPYGLNTHRLLVRGHRTGTVPARGAVTADALKLEPYFIMPFLMVGMALLIAARIVISAFAGRRNKRKLYNEIPRGKRRYEGKDPSEKD
jgi:sortase A